MSSKNSARKESEADLDVAPAANFVDFSPDEIKDVQLHECIWQGPYSTTFRATYKPSGEVVAVKILYLNRPEVRVESTKQLTKLAKAKSVCADGISKVLAFGETNSAIFVVRQYIEGISLLQAISQGAIPPRDAVRHARDIALAIDEASAQGVTHCGIRPSQIVLCSKNHGTFEKHGVVLDHASLMAIVTDLGALAPSLRWDRRLMPPVAMWMPPEQLAQSTALESLRVDVYSIGAVLYFMLTGRPPFFVAGGELLGQLISSELPARASQLNPLVDSSLDAIVFRCIEKNPRDRFESASALADELDAYLNIPSERFGVVSRGQCRRDVASRVEFRRITQCLIAMAVCLAGALIWFQPTMKMDSSRKFQVSEGDIGDSIFYRNCIAAAILKANSNDSDGALAVLVGASDVSRGWEWGVTRRLCSATGVPVDDEGTWGWCSDVKVSGEQFEVRKSKKYALHRVAEMQGFVGIRIFVDLGGGLQWGGSNVVGDLGDVGIALCESSCFVDCEFCDGFDASKACSCRTQDCSALKVGVGCFCVQESFCKRDVSISRLAQSVIVSGCWGSWELFDLEGHESFVRVATVSGDRRWLATGDDDGFVVITDLWEGKQKVRCPVSLGAIRDLSFDPDSGDLLIASGCDIRSWRTESMVDVPCVATRNTGCAVVAFHLIEKSFLSGGQDGAIEAFDGETGEFRRSYCSDGPAVSCLALAPHGKWFVTGGPDGVVRLRDWKFGRVLAECGGEGTAGVAGLSVHRSGVPVAVAHVDGQVALWDAGNRRLLRTFAAHEGPVNCVAYFPDGLKLATAGDDHVARIWIAGSRFEPKHLRGHRAPIVALAVADDSRSLATADRDGVVIHWDAESGKPLRQWTAHRGAVTALTFGDHDRRLVTAGEDRRVKVWDSATGIEYPALPPQRAVIRSLAFGNDGLTLATVGDNGRLKLWHANPW